MTSSVVTFGRRRFLKTTGDKKTEVSLNRVERVDPMSKKKDKTPTREASGYFISHDTQLKVAGIWNLARVLNFYQAE